MPPGLSEDVIRLISAKKNEPQWLLDWRLKAYRHWLTMTPPDWAKLKVPAIDLQSISYYSQPKSHKDAPKSLDEVDPKLLETYKKLGIPLHEQAMLAGVVSEQPVPGADRQVAMDVVFDSVSVATTFKSKLREAGVIGSASIEHDDAGNATHDRLILAIQPAHPHYRFSS